MQVLTRVLTCLDTTSVRPAGPAPAQPPPVRAADTRIADWDLLFHAVLARLGAMVDTQIEADQAQFIHSVEDVQQAVREGVEALRRLQADLTEERAGRPQCYVIYSKL